MLVTTWKIEPSARLSSRFAPQCGSSVPAATWMTAGTSQFVQSNVTDGAVWPEPAVKRGSQPHASLAIVWPSLCSETTTGPSLLGWAVRRIVYVSPFGSPWATSVEPSDSTM